jgi:hypothetical protein
MAKPGFDEFGNTDSDREGNIGLSSGRFTGGKLVKPGGLIRPGGVIGLFGGVSTTFLTTGLCAFGLTPADGVGTGVELALEFEFEFEFVTTTVTVIV